MVQSKKKFIVGTRGSQLATTQTNWVIEELKKCHPNVDFECRVIKTQGDADQSTLLEKFPEMGVFVKELEIALLEERIDFAVHSLKDVPESGPEPLAIVSYPARQDAKDVFISKGKRFREIPSGAIIGTGSPRRILQLKAIRDDVKYQSIRGNLDTRLNKVASGELDGIVLAAAGLNRLGLADRITHSFSMDDMIPAIGQGALALECRATDLSVIELLRSVNDDLTEAAVLMERHFMTSVGGGCKVPMACHVIPTGDEFRMMAIMGDPKSNLSFRIERTSPEFEVEMLVRELTKDMLRGCSAKGIPIPKDLPPHHLLNPSAT